MVAMKNELKSMFTEHWKYLAVSAACELNLFDKINEGHDKLNELAESNNWNENALSHLLNYLSVSEYLNCDATRTYRLTEKGNLLRKNNPDGLYYACLNWSGEHLTAWQNLSYSIQTGESAFEHLYRKPFFDYLNEHPETLRNYHLAMFQYAIDDYKELPHIIDFGVHHSIMDVGGGYGAAINIIQSTNQNSNCILFDLEKVIREVTKDSIKKVAGNFFEDIPNIADGIILSRVIHDWNDEKATLILRNCFKALPQNGTLYLIENCKDKIQSDLSSLSLNMTVMCQSYERSSTEYKKICKDVGFTYQSEHKLNQLQTILIFQK
jgi:C-methyltransferase